MRRHRRGIVIILWVTWSGLSPPGGDDPPLVFHIALHITSVFILDNHLFLSNLAETTLWWRWPPRDFLVLHLAAKDFLRNTCFPPSSGHLKLHFFLSLQWELQFSNDYNLINIINIALGTWQRNPLVEMTPWGLSCTPPGHERIFEKYVFSTE